MGDGYTPGAVYTNVPGTWENDYARLLQASKEHEQLPREYSKWQTAAAPSPNTTGTLNTTYGSTPFTYTTSAGGQTTCFSAANVRNEADSVIDWRSDPSAILRAARRAQGLPT